LVPVRQRRRQPRSGCQEAIPRRGCGHGPRPNPASAMNRSSVSRKGHEIVALVYLRKKVPPPVNRCSNSGFVLCQCKSGSGASLDACDGSGALCRVRPAVRWMSDREFCVFVSKANGQTPKSVGEGSEALCVWVHRRPLSSRSALDNEPCAGMIEIRRRYLKRTIGLTPHRRRVECSHSTSAVVLNGNV